MTQPKVFCGSFILKLVFTLSLVLSGCTVPQSAPEPSVAEVTFVALTANWGHYATLADAFNAQHPGVRVHVIDPASLRGPAPGDEAQQAVRVADAVLMPEVDLTLAGNSGIFWDLTTLAQRDGDLAPHDFYPELLSRFQERGGATWGIPLGVSPLLLAYDRARFDAAGVPYPEPGWNWDQFLTTAQQLTDPAQAQWGFAGFTPGTFDLAAFILQYGGTVVEDGRPTLDTPRNAEALAWVADLARVHGVMPSEPAASLAPLARVAAMWLQRPGGGLRTTTGLAPLPEGARYAALDIVYGGYISAGSQAPEAAWQWLLYLTHQPPPGELLPVRPSVLESTVGPRDTWYSAYRYALEHVAPEPWHHLRAFSPAWSWLADEGLAALLAGSAAAPDVLRSAQSLALENPASPPMSGPPPTVAPPPQADPTALRTLVWRDRHAYEAVARHYVASLDASLRITVEGFESGVVDLPAERAEFDVFAAQTNFRAEEVAGHWLTLDPFIDGDDAFALDDFYPRALDTYRRDGKLWALPIEVDTPLLFYNRAAFDAADLPYPDGTWTWEDLAAAAERLSTGENWERQWGLVTPMTGWESVPLIRAAQQLGRGGPLVDDPEQPTAPTLDREAVVESVRWYAALARDRQVLAPPGLYIPDWQTSLTLIEAGKAAMWISTVGFWGAPLDRPDVQLDTSQIGVAPLPVTGSPYTTMGAMGYGISAHSAQPQAAWQWLVHLTQQPALVHGLPARRSLLNRALFPAFPDALQPALRQAFRTTLETYGNSGFSATRAGIPWYDVAYRLYRLAVRETLETGADPAVTLGAAQATAEAYMACLQSQALLESNEGPRDPNHLPPEITAACEEAAGVPPAVLWYDD